MSTVRSFADLTTSMANASRAPASERRTTPNPRIAAGMTSEEWDRRRRRERRTEWEATTRAATQNGPPVRDVKRFVSFEDAMIERLRAESCLAKTIPLSIDLKYPLPQSGPSVGAYYRAKFRRFGTLGERGDLCPFRDAILEDALREATQN